MGSRWRRGLVRIVSRRRCEVVVETVGLRVVGFVRRRMSLSYAVRLANISTVELCHISSSLWLPLSTSAHVVASYMLFPQPFVDSTLPARNFAYSYTLAFRC